MEGGSGGGGDLVLSDSGNLRVVANDLEDEGVRIDRIEENDLELDGGRGEMEDGKFDLEADDGNDPDESCDQMLNLDYCDREENGDDSGMNGGQGVGFCGKEYLPPVVGMGFESYDDAYNYYNCYAKESGFAIRVKSSWTKRNSKEKRGAVLCCNCEGFKTVKEANSRRKETRTGCLAMVRLRLAESNRWRVDEVKLEHNHSFDHGRAQSSKSHKKMEVGVKRNIEPVDDDDVEVRTIKLYKTAAVDPLGYGSSNEVESNHHPDMSKCLKLRKGDARVIYDYFCQAQLTSPNFFYLMDLNDDGFLRNVFWIDPRSRPAYRYFGDVVTFDTTCLSNDYEVPFVAFVGVNHHGQKILLGSGFLVDGSFETYVWLFRAWLSCMSGRPPQTIISNQCKAMQSAIGEVFPRAHHCIDLSPVMQTILDNLRGTLHDLEAFQMVLNGVVYDSLKVDEFEMAWEDMVQKFGVAENELLRTLYEDRGRWAPVYLKDASLVGMSSFQKGQSIVSFFDGLVNRHTLLREFFDIYDFELQKKHRKEVLDDLESRDCIPALRTGSPFELQLSKVYTNAIFRKFQDEVARIPSCYSTAQAHSNGPVSTHTIKEHEEEENPRDAKDYEVIYDKAAAEVRCVCSCFNFEGYLCRHALRVLNYHRVEEVPLQYILPRWRKDLSRLYSPDLGSNNIDMANPAHWFDHLQKRAMQVVEEGMLSPDHHTAALLAFKESLNKVRLVADKSAS